MLIALSILVCPSYAHSGRTDSNGGHHVAGTNEYHYHHGYPAHQHENGICPYAKSSNQGLDTFLFVPLGLLLTLAPHLVFFLFSYVKMKIEDKRSKREYEEKRNYYLNLYASKTRRDIAIECGMPTDTEIGPDGLPKQVDMDDWGPMYTFFVSAYGHTFHQKKTCNAAICARIHAVQIGTRVPCSRCRPTKPDMSWYWKYNLIIQRLNECNIHLPWTYNFVCGVALDRSKHNKEQTS